MTMVTNEFLGKSPGHGLKDWVKSTYVKIKLTNCHSSGYF